MKHLINYATVCFAILFTLTVNAQTNIPTLEPSLLWEVSGKGITRPSYLYGTIHMICADDFFLADKTKKAFEAADQLLLEVNFSDSNEIKHAQNSAVTKTLLSHQLSKDELAKLDSIVKRSIGMSIAQLDNYSLSTVMSIVTMKSFGCASIKSYENEFIEKAKKAKQPISGLETVKFQFEMLDAAYSTSEMIRMLEEVNTAETAKLMAAYKRENIDDLFNVMTDTKIMSENTKSEILDKRNINWVNQMPGLMKDKSIFVAVGAAHLAGEYGVINLLRKSGYVVKPIMK